MRPLLLSWLVSGLVSGLVFAGAACGPSHVTDDPAPVDGGIVGEAAAPDAKSPVVVGPGLAGTLRDEAGQPLADETVLACMATVCLSGKTGGDGRFSFAIEAPASVALKTAEDLSKIPRRGASLLPVEIENASLVEVGDIHVPTLPDGTRLGPPTDDPQRLSAGDGLELTLRRADLKPRLGDELFDVAARKIAPERMPTLAALGDEEVVALYALHPFAATSKSPVAARVPSTLPSGTAVKFRTISEIDGHLSEPVPGKADGSAVVTDPSRGIDELTWLVVSR